MNMELFNLFQNMVNNHSLKMKNNLLSRCIYDFNYYFIQDNNQNLPNFQQIRNLSKIIIIDACTYQPNQYFIICFDSNLIIINETELYRIQHIFWSINSTIYFIKENIKSRFFSELEKITQMPHTSIKTVEIGPNFESEIESFSDNLILNNQQAMDFYEAIRESISGYFIKRSYMKTKVNRIEKYQEILQSRPKELIIHKNECIHLRNLGGSNTAYVELIYHIEREELFVAKIMFDSESPKLFPRELNNYLDCHHPFLSKYYGTIEDGDKKYLGIEYIQGLPLNCIHKMNLSFYDMSRIAFEIMIAIEYIHDKDYIYRDLKPSNIMIDSNKTAVLIDFDRMIKNEEENTGSNSTATLNIEFGSPELINGEEYSKETDIYSLGKITSFLFSQNNNQIDSSTQNTYSEIQEIIKNCTQMDKNNRPTIAKLINSFYRKCILVNIMANFTNADVMYYWGIIGEYSYHEALNNLGFFILNVHKNIEKGIHYLSLAADVYNNAEAQFNLGKYYFDIKNINKSINYFALSAKNNFDDAQFILGDFYYVGEFVNQDIDKAINYYTQAANQNHIESQFKLGMIYLNIDPNKSLYYLTHAANQGHPYGQFCLGNLYLKGYVVSRDINKALFYLQESANQNNSLAQCYIGNIYNNGILVSKDINKAIYYYTLSANNNEPEAIFRLGFIYYEGKYIRQDINKGLNLIIKASQLNYLEAINFLGFIYYEGKYCKQNMEQAIFYWKKAAEKNYLMSQYNLGLVYYEGKFVERDIKQSIYYLEKATQQNKAEAQYLLGVIYFEGKYVKQNVDKSIYYLKLSSKQDYIESNLYLGKVYYEGKYLTRDVNQSIYYFSKAANQNSSNAQYNLGYIYIIGNYIPQDIEKSIYYFKLAANKKHKQSQYYLGYIYFKGIGVPKDIKKAFKYLTESANQNLPEAFSLLSSFYFNGIGVPKNVNKAIYYLKIAANEGISWSQFNLAYFYYKGEYVSQDIKKAVIYLKLSKDKEVNSLFLLGNIYYEGKYLPRNIKKAIKYYKDASSLNSFNAKNNLGIIYKKGIGIEPNIPYAIELFSESIKLGNDPASMYNLSHIYFFEEKIEKNVDEIISLLVKSIQLNFYPSKYLLMLVLVSMNKPITLSIIENVLRNNNELNEIKTESLAKEFYTYIKENELEGDFYYSILYEKVKKEDYIYNVFQPILSSTFESKCQNNKIEFKSNISSLFYDGFGV